MKPYDCSVCPAFCCGYPDIPATRADIARIARHLKTTALDAREKFTEAEGRRRKMKHRPDAKFGATVCVFLNQKTRSCGIYRARPAICRDYPGDRCEWHDRMMLESIAAGKRVIKLRKAPWTVDSDHPSYTEKNLPKLVADYAGAKMKR